MRLRHKICGLALIALPVLAQASDRGKSVTTGMASYYASAFTGSRTASGERFIPSALTAAHRSFPFNSRVTVTNLANGRDVIVRINDRGPWTKGRIIDVSLAAAKTIGMHRSGTAKVKLELLD